MAIDFGVCAILTVPGPNCFCSDRGNAGHGRIWVRPVSGLGKNLSSLHGESEGCRSCDARIGGIRSVERKRVRSFRHVIAAVGASTTTAAATGDQENCNQEATTQAGPDPNAAPTHAEKQASDRDREAERNRPTRARITLRGGERFRAGSDEEPHAIPDPP